MKERESMIENGNISERKWRGGQKDKEEEQRNSRWLKQRTVGEKSEERERMESNGREKQSEREKE